MATPVCEYYKFGYCKYRSSCRHRHVQTICEDESCNIIACENRHPVVCKFFSKYGRCKYNPCSYKHIVDSSYAFGDSQKKIEDNENKIKENAREINELKNQVTKLQNTIDQMHCVYSRIDSLERFFNKSNADSLEQFTRSSTLSSRVNAESGSTGSVLVYEMDNACCDHQHRLDGDIPPNGSCCYHRCRPKSKKKKI